MHELVGGAEVVDVGLPQRGAGELDVRPSPVGRNVEALPLQQRVRLHAPVLVRRAHHRVPQRRPHPSPLSPLTIPLVPQLPLLRLWFFLVACFLTPMTDLQTRPASGPTKIYRADHATALLLQITVRFASKFGNPVDDGSIRVWFDRFEIERRRPVRMPSY